MVNGPRKHESSCNVSSIASAATDKREPDKQKPKHPSWEKEKCAKAKKDCICHKRSDLQIYLGCAGTIALFPGDDL